MLWCFALLAVLGQTPSEPYQWPLDLPRVVTSSFGEYRVGRFHMGIDLRTNGVGKEVRAAADGYVSRVRCSPWGYGKAVYLKFNDGNSVVYGHLSEFATAVRDYVRVAQHAAKSYTVDLFPKPGQFPVKRGDVIARSGDTGIGVAHLHFEPRDAAERPVSPRLLGFSWPDSTPPVIERVLVMPAGPGSAVRGDIEPVVLVAKPSGEGQYRCDPITASGRIGFGVDVVDYANHGENQLGVYKLRTRAGDEEVFHIATDHLSYDDRENAAVSFHPFFLDKGRFLLQWRWPGNVCEVFKEPPRDGWFEVPNSPVEVHIEAEDFLGNVAQVTIPVRPQGEASVPEPHAAAGGQVGNQAASEGTVDVACVGEWLVLTATFTQPEPVAPILSFDGPPPLEGGAFRRVDAKTFRAGYRPAPDARDVTLAVNHERIKSYSRRLAVFHRGDDARMVNLDDLTIAVQPNSPYGTLFARVFTPRNAPPSPIRKLGKIYEVWPTASPIDAPVDLSLPFPTGAVKPERVHVYRSTVAGWAREETQRSQDRLAISTTRFGVFAAMEDDKPPRISDIVPAPGPCQTKRPAIRAKVTDQGSGIVEFTVTCDGQWLLVGYDPEANMIQWEQDENLPSGEHELLFTVTDAAGNATTASRKINIPG